MNEKALYLGGLYEIGDGKSSYKEALSFQVKENNKIYKAFNRQNLSNKWVRGATGMRVRPGRSIPRGDMKKELPAGAIKSGIRPSPKKPRRLKA